MENRDTHQLSIIITEKCNLNCSYCYCDKNSTNTVKFETACKRIDDFLFNKSKDSNIIHILFIGGEPFCEFELLQNIVNYTILKYPLLNIHFKVVTNGTLVHGKIQDWLITNQKHFSVELSLDGEKDSQNKSRGNTYNSIDISFFKDKLKHSVVNKVISPSNIESLAKDVIFMENQGFRIKAVIADGVNWSEGNNPEILSQQLKQLINHYIRNKNQQPFNLLCHALYCINNPDITISKCEAGSKSYAIDTKGNIHSCHRCSEYYNNGAWKIPNNKINLQIVPLLNDACKHCCANIICNSCPASVASKIDNHTACKMSCLLSKVLFYANAYFYIQLLMNCPDHIYFRGRNKEQIHSTYKGARHIIENLNPEQAF